jgi:tetratricopeptide (TPR) repeat protein
MIDYLEFGDLVAAKGLAALALAQAVTGDPMTRAEAILAFGMDYPGHAEGRAQLLPESDPLRHFLLKENTRLERVALEPNASIEARYLWLLRLGQGKDEGKWAATWEQLSEGLPKEPSLLKTGLELDDFGKGPSLATSLLEMVLGASGAPDDNSMSENIDWIETRWHQSSKRYQGPFADTRLVSAVDRSMFFSGLHVIGIHLLDRLASIRAARDFCLELGTGGTGTAADFRRWYTNLVASEEGTGGAAPLCEDATAVSTLGIPARRRSIVSLWNHPGTFKDRHRRIMLQCGRAMLPRMDSRLSHRRVLNEHSVNLLLDPMLEEQTLRSLVKAAASTDYEQHFNLARFVGDRDTLESLLQSQNVPGRTRFESVRALVELGMPDDESWEWLERLIARDPDQWEIVGPIAFYLEDQERYEHAKKVATEWLKRPERSGGFDTINARNLLARVYYGEERYEEAYRAVEPAISSYQEGALIWGTILLDRLGRRDDAEQLGLASVERYPDSAVSRGVLAELYWRRNEPDRAAQVLEESPNRLSEARWERYVVPRFEHAFRDRSPQETLEAYVALNRHGFKPRYAFARSFARKGDFEKAFLLSTADLEVPDDWNVFSSQLESYIILDEWKGRAQALEWIREYSDLSRRDYNSLTVYGQGRWELLWGLIDDPDPQGFGEMVWLLRAAASLRTPDDPHREEVLQHYRTATLPAAEVGKYLLGLTDEANFFDLAKTPRDRCASAYYFGVKAIAEGRYEDALEWFRVSHETGATEAWEYDWAYRQLARWAGKDISFSRIVEVERATVKTN